MGLNITHEALILIQKTVMRFPLIFSTELNSTMRSIDLTTHIVAPFVMGQIITFGSPFAGAAFIGIWNLISLVLEYFLLHAIYKSVPQLSEKIIKTEEMDKPLWNFWETHDAWKLYFNHPIRFAGIGFALLFMTVMGFDSITLGKFLFNLIILL